MRIVDPFKVMAYQGSKFDSYIDISPQVHIFDDGGGLPRKYFIGFDSKTNKFLPLEIGVNWGKTDRIRIEIETIYNLKHELPSLDPFSDYRSIPKAFFGEGSGRLRSFQEWTIQYPQEGLNISKLKSNPGNGVIESKGDLALVVSHVASENPQGFKGSFIAIDTNVAISQSGGGGVTFNIGPVSTDVGGSSPESRSFNYELLVYLSVIGRPNVVATPRPLEVPEDLLTHSVYFEAENQKDLSAEELRRLEDKWHDPLFRQSPKLYNAIKSGKCQIWLSGYASTTGKEANNKNLSKDRITSVEEALKTDLFKSKNIKFVRLPQGDKSSTQKGAIARERRVEIQIQKWEAITAMT
ncbi:MAG: hypothetical protein P9F75_06570 [Candidatus Contendobacter sp.]|nr:hypothetical protein [Candidatus Contendobacter sp.]